MCALARCRILGKNPDSTQTRNLVTKIVSDVPKGSRRITVSDGTRLPLACACRVGGLLMGVRRHVQVASTKGVSAGQWLRLFVTAPNNRNRRRRGLLGEEHSRRGLRLSAAPGPGEANPVPLVARLFDDAAVQQGLNAAFVAEAQRADALAANPDKVPAQWLEPNATNPLGLDPWLLAVGRFAANALLAEAGDGAATGGERAPGQALDGTLDAYLYGENVADSGRNGGTASCQLVAEDSCLGLVRVRVVADVDDPPIPAAGVYPKDDHVRFVSRFALVLRLCSNAYVRCTRLCDQSCRPAPLFGLQGVGCGLQLDRV